MAEESKEKASEDTPTGGERLRIARRENDISIRDVAKELHLDEPKVRALEKNDFEVLGAPVFAKGHLRKYAELVGVPVDDIMADYYQMNRSVGAPPVVGPRKKADRDLSLGPWIGVLAVLALFGGGFYWWMNRDVVSEPANNVEPATLAPFTDVQDSDQADEPEGATGVSIEPASDISATSDAAESTELMSAPAAAEASVSTTDTAPQAMLVPPQEQPSVTYDIPTQAQDVQPASDLPQVEVELAFTGDCWTEVSDASGRRLYYDLGESGAVVTLSGDAPLRVVLGDSNNVNIKVAGSDFVIPQSARSGRLARLTLNNP